MSRYRRLTILALILMPLFLLAAPAHAQTPSISSDAFVVLTGRIDVASGETVSDAVIFNGPVRHRGDRREQRGRVQRRRDRSPAASGGT